MKPEESERPGDCVKPGQKTSARQLSTKIATLVISSVLSLVLVEIGLRLFFGKELATPALGNNLLYRYDARFGWFPVPNSTNLFRNYRTVAAVHNSKGFRDIEHVGDSNKPGVLFLGDSFVWGFDVEAAERFTDKLRARHSEWAIFNCGVSGYGTDQEFLLLQKCFDDYKPRVVFLIFCTENDEADNHWSFRYECYFKPYYSTNEHGLELHGVPVPRGERTFYLGQPLILRLYLARLIVRVYCHLTNPPHVHVPSPTFVIIQEMQKYLQERGVILAVGATLKYPRLGAFLYSAGIPFLDFSSCEQYPAVGHWSPKGHDCVCEAINQFLTNTIQMTGGSHKQQVQR